MLQVCIYIQKAVEVLEEVEPILAKHISVTSEDQIKAS